MNLKTQKILSFIPIAHISIIVFRIIGLVKYFPHFRSGDSKALLRLILAPFKVIGAIILFTIPRILFSILAESDLIYNIAVYSTLYLTFVAIARIGILEQNSYLKNQ